MILIFFLWLKLSILHLCVSDLGYQCFLSDDWWMTLTANDKPEIVLIYHTDYSTTRYYNNILRSRFKEACEPFYKINSDFLKYAKYKKHSNFIHFGFPYYKDKKLPEDFEYAGNVTKTKEVVCNKTGKSNDFDCHEFANIVSKSVITMNGGHIYNYVQKMDITNKENNYDITNMEDCKPFVQLKTINLTKVLLCTDGNKPVPKVNILPLKLIIKPIDSIRCLTALHELDDQFLAVLLPTPLEVFTEYLVPTIFYETPYVFSENRIAYPNSMNVVPWQLLKYGFLKFIRTVGWQRVLIVTDDSEYSLEFENELMTLFNKEQLSYAVLRCEDANCEMDKVIQELHRGSAKIVIANVEAEHALYLVKNANPKITWIMRDIPQDASYRPYLKAFSISLRKVHHPEGCTDLDDNTLTGLSSIALAYKNLSKEDFDVKKKEFYRLFADKAKQIITRKTEATAVVHTGRDTEIATMYVDDNGAKLLYFEDPFKSGKPSDGTTHCFTISYDYFNPCEDNLVILLMFVILICILTFLLIICYFNKTSPFNDIRYRSF